MPTEKQKVRYLMSVIEDLLESKEFGQFGPVYKTPSGGLTTATKPRTRRKLSAWNKFVKANSKKPRFIMRSGKLNLKKMGVAFRKKKR